MREKNTRRKLPFAQCALTYLTGCWINNSGSPPVHIYKHSHSYHIVIEYKDGTQFDVPIIVHKKKMQFNFFGLIELAYDEENDLLLIALFEGVYRMEGQE